MRWDARIRRYRNERGRVLTPRQVRKQVEDYVDQEVKKASRSTSVYVEKRNSGVVRQG